jgi:hypothetical protein
LRNSWDTEAFKKLVGGSAGLSAALALLSGHGKNFQDNLKAMGNATGSTEKAFQSWEGTLTAHLDKIGAAISVFATRLMDQIANNPQIIAGIDAITSAIGKMADFILSHGNIVMPILAGLAAMFGVILVGAIVVFLAPVVTLISTIGPVILVIGALAVGAVLLVQHWRELIGAFSAHGPLSQVMAILRDIGNFLAANFMPVWHQLVDLWRTQIVPLGNQLWSSIQPLMPLFEGLAIIIGAILVVALGLIVAVLAGVIKGFAGFLSGLVIVIGGIVRLVTGLIQIISGVLRVIFDIFTLNFSDLGPALGQIWAGIINVFRGAWDIGLVSRKLS